MSLRREIADSAIQSLDRPGFRWILSGAFSAAGRLYKDGPTSVRFDDAWIHRFGPDQLAELRPRRRTPELTEARVQEYCCHLYRPRPGDTVIDVGAGYGWEALYFARKIGEDGCVIAIEAHPALARCMAKSVKLSGLTQISPQHYAISDRSETLFIEDDLAHHVGNAVRRSAVSDEIAVDAISLDELCDQLGIGDVAFLKMNVEGAEQLAIRGMRRMIERTQVVAISCHDFRFEKTGNEFFRTRRLVEGWLRERGFVIVPRQSRFPWLRDQVNAFNPNLIEREQLNPAAFA